MFSAITWLFCPPGSDAEPLEDADDWDLNFLRRYLADGGSFGASGIFAWTGNQSGVIYDYFKAPTMPGEETEGWDGPER